MVKQIHGKTLTQWLESYPALQPVVSLQEVWWTNPACSSELIAAPIQLTLADIQAAEQRLQRFAPYIAKVFPTTRSTAGIIESPLAPVPRMQKSLEAVFGVSVPGAMYAKYDSHLPIAGSIKARGGVYEVLKVAETLAMEQGLLREDDDYGLLAGEKFRRLFAEHSIAVGSTGNLGLSIGIMSAKLGFRATVHMSAEAKQWKKGLLRAQGVRVIEYESDFTQAVASGRAESAKDGNSHFVDDENSSDLFLGYAVAALRLQKQLAEQKVTVDAGHPLFVYLPCGVGGSPGGITFGLKLVFGANVHCIFAEPTHAPCMLLGLLTGRHDGVCVQDFGIDNVTVADGLAVGRPSGFVGKNVGVWIDGVYTVEDRSLYRLLALLADSEQMSLEPSALAGFAGPARLLADEAGQRCLAQCGLTRQIGQATHIAWATGGSMVPADIMADFYRQGKMAAN
jgi:D-serine dehydratase